MAVYSLKAINEVRIIRFLAQFPIVAAFLAATWPSTATPATITDLGTLGGSFSAAYGINDAGQVVGDSKTATGDFHAFLYSAGTMTDLGTLHGTSDYSFADSINVAGQIVGTSYGNNSGLETTYGFLYTAGTMMNLGANTQANAINAAGQVVGLEWLTTYYVHAILYSGGAIVDLGTLGGLSSGAEGINAAGQIVGSSDTSAGTDPPFHAFLYSGGRMVDLGTLGGSNSAANAINDAGQIVGWAITADDRSHAFLYTAGGMVDLGTLSGGGSQAYAINDAGQVVGADNGYTAFLYTDGKMIDLNSLLPPNSGWYLDQATGINDLGQIVGIGSFNGHDAAFLLNTAPEPGSFALTGASMAILALAWKKRKSILSSRA